MGIFGFVSEKKYNNLLDCYETLKHNLDVAQSTISDLKLENHNLKYTLESTPKETTDDHYKEIEDLKQQLEEYKSRYDSSRKMIDNIMKKYNAVKEELVSLKHNNSVETFRDPENGEIIESEPQETKDEEIIQKKSRRRRKHRRKPKQTVIMEES